MSNAPKKLWTLAVQATSHTSRTSELDHENLSIRVLVADRIRTVFLWFQRPERDFEAQVEPAFSAGLPDAASRPPQRPGNVTSREEDPRPSRQDVDPHY